MIDIPRGTYSILFPVVAIFFSVKLPKAELPEWMDWILVGFVVFHVLVHLIFSVSEGACVCLSIGVPLSCPEYICI